MTHFKFKFMLHPLKTPCWWDEKNSASKHCCPTTQNSKCSSSQRGKGKKKYLETVSLVFCLPNKLADTISFMLCVEHAFSDVLCNSYSKNFLRYDHAKLRTKQVELQGKRMYTSKHDRIQWLDTYVVWVESTDLGITPWHSIVKWAFCFRWASIVNPPPWFTHSMISPLWQSKTNIRRKTKLYSYIIGNFQF